ncbi:hypothetical protein CHS0354_025623 [Potamilus streckersoni]|uniref:Uncharacterized protein n=1 Tax=Potamilus streckersoni TaxID=2493646 RepID=A0AAE0S1G7_9BIVA|nr:hypothetical protein CHS0354_025623 [Potamilus streckersoni]
MHLCVLRFVVNLRAGRLSKINTSTETNTDDRNENLQEEISPLNYWTIVDNERGELSTGIEIIVDQAREPQSIGQIIVPTNIESLRPMFSSNIKYNDEPDGYLNPIQSHSVKFDKYIRPVYVHTVNKGFVCTNQST